MLLAPSASSSPPMQWSEARMTSSSNRTQPCTRRIRPRARRHARSGPRSSRQCRIRLQQFRRAARFAFACETAKFHVEAMLPFVVVDARPVEEAAQVDAVVDGLLDDCKRLAQDVAAP